MRISFLRAGSAFAHAAPKLQPGEGRTIALLVLQEMFEFYDFFLVGYLVSVLAPGCVTSIPNRPRRQPT